MFKPLSFLTALLVVGAFGASAQTDTAYNDLGRVLVKKNFTQSVTIKGSDLERFQFSDLADALNVWLYGTYTNSANLVYVIDGNMVTDANAYSIYDVDEITLVQNAAAYVSGANPGAQLVIVKLKTPRPGKQGIEAAGQTSLVNLQNQGHVPNVNSTHNIYDQYYLSGYKNFTNVNFGVSADFQHDVLPVLTNGTVSPLDPYYTNRFKLNAFADAKLWRGTTLKFNINYVPQTDGFQFAYNSPAGNEMQNYAQKVGVHQHMASSSLSINSKIIGGLNNTLSAAYNHYNDFGTGYTDFSSTDANTQDFSHSIAENYVKTSDFLLRDNLWYHAQLGSFSLEPGVNFSFRRFINDNSTSNFYESTINGNLGPVQSSSAGNAQDYKKYLVTPSVNLFYKDVVNLQGGFSYFLNSAANLQQTYAFSRLAPFVTTSVNILKAADVNAMSLRLFGSFSRQSALFTDDYASLAGITPFVYLITNTDIGFFQYSTGAASYNYQVLNPYHQYNTWQAGFDWRFLPNFTLTYNYWKYQSIDEEQIAIPYSGNESQLIIQYYYTKVATNRLALNYTLSSSQFNWHTGLNVSESKVQPIDPASVSTYMLPYITSGHRFSGGFTNRLTYKTFFAGMDLLYQFGNRGISLADDDPYELLTVNNKASFSLQDIYLGSEIRINHLKHAELFFNTRNMWQNASSNITDNRRFYGLGMKVNL